MCFSTICRTSNILFTSCPPICTCLPLVDLWPCWSCVPWFSLYGCAGQSFIGKAAMHHYLSDFEFLEGFSGIIDSYLLFQDFTFTAQEACWSYCHWNSEQWSTPEDLDNIVNLWIGHGPHFWHHSVINSCKNDEKNGRAQQSCLQLFLSWNGWLVRLNN